MNDSLLTLDETGAEPDEVVVRTDEYGVLICPDGREPVESLTCPTLPVDGGTVFCDLDMGSDTENTVRGHRVYIGAMIMDDTLPAWVRALYGPAVASTTERMLSQTSAAAVSQTIETTWRQRPTATARALHRLMLGIWMRRYWPFGPLDAGIPQCRDVPDIMNLDFVETPRDNGPFGSTGCAEGFQSAGCVAILNAIADAVGLRITALPATPAKVKATILLHFPKQRVFFI